MAESHIHRLEALEHWRHRLILAAGVLFVGHAIIRGIEAFTTTSPPADVFGPAGYVAALLGLVGVYPTVADQTPRLGRIAVGIAVILIPGWALTAGLSFGEAAGILPPQTTLVPAVFFVALIVSTLLVYLLFGVASLRTDSHRRSLGVLLLTPAALLAFLIVGGAVLSIAPAMGGVIIGGGLAICHGAIGGVLSTGRTETGRVDSAVDVTVE